MNIATRLFYRTLYRPLMRLAHRYHWHYMPECGPFEDGSKQAWCRWCGGRHTVYDPERVSKLMTARTEGDGR